MPRCLIYIAFASICNSIYKIVCGSIEKVIPPAYNSPGMSGETVTMVIMNIDKTQYPEMPENHQEASEDIETIVVSRSKLAEFVAGAVERGDGIDARIAVFAAML